MLETRLLLTSGGTHDIELVGRTAAGAWWAAGYDFGPQETPGTITNAVFGAWSPLVDWQNVRFGDFDGDGLQDVIGRDPSTGYWWTTLSDMIGSTTVVGTHWSTATAWKDVAVVDLAPAGDRGDYVGHFTHKNDLVGRTSSGTWWAAISNGDGTFTNTVLGHWSPSAGWQDTQFADINSDGATDIVSRNAAGGWWALVSRGRQGLDYDTVRLGGWNPTAGWQDVRITTSLLPGTSAAVLGRASGGAWWALAIASEATATNRFVTLWNEAAGWRNIVVANLDGHSGQELVGQTSDGEWWRLLSDPATTVVSESIGWTPPVAELLVAQNVENAVRTNAGSPASICWSIAMKMTFGLANGS